MLSYQQRKSQLQKRMGKKVRPAKGGHGVTEPSTCPTIHEEPRRGDAKGYTFRAEGDSDESDSEDGYTAGDAMAAFSATCLFLVVVCTVVVVCHSHPPVPRNASQASVQPAEGETAGKETYAHRQRLHPRPGGTVLSWAPRIMLFEDVLTPAECDGLIARAANRLKGVGTFSEADAWIRTSQSMWFSEPEDARDQLVRSIRARLLDMVLVPSTHAEDLQVTRYMPGDKYDLHYDFSQPDRAIHSPDKFPYGDVERAATVLVYLTDAFEGGETLFPRVATPGSQGRNLLQRVPRVDSPAWEKVGNLDEFCGTESGSDALRAKPLRRGGAVVFFGYTPEGVRDMDSIHGSCPVLSGVKIVAQQWIQINTMYAGKHRLESVPEALPPTSDASAMAREPGADAARDAIATLVTTREYALGAVVLGRTLRATGSVKNPMRDMVALVPPHGSQGARLDAKAVAWMREAGWIVKRVACLSHVAGASRSFLRPDLAAVSFSKIHLWNMTQYDRVLFIDADAMVLRNIDFLFGPTYWTHPSSGDFAINGVQETNGQVKTGLFGLRPSERTFARLVDGLQRDDVDFSNNEQGYISKVLEPDWKRVPEEQHMPYKLHLCAGACALKDQKFGGAWRDQVQGGVVVDFQGLSKPWTWPQQIGHEKCRVMHVFALLWQILAMSPTGEDTGDTLRKFQQLREERNLIASQDEAVQSALQPWLMRITEKVGAMNARGGKPRKRAMKTLCESKLMDMELPMLGLAGVFSQLCALYAHGPGIGNL